jgi:hypothetical protein
MINKSATFILSVMMTLVFLMPSAYADDTNARNTYAVIWTIDTDDVELFNSTVGLHSTKVLEMWSAGIVENVYIDTDKNHDALSKGDPARVMFFIKAKTEAEAKKILDELPLAKKKVAVYNLLPVGTLWLKQF